MSDLEYSFPNLFQKTKKFFKSRDRSSYEVRSFLISKGENENHIESFIHEAKSIDLINDRRFLENYIFSKLENQGRIKIFYDLENMGFPSNQIQMVWEKFQSMEIEKLENLILKKLESQKSFHAEKEFLSFVRKGTTNN